MFVFRLYDYEAVSELCSFTAFFVEGNYLDDLYI